MTEKEKVLINQIEELIFDRIFSDNQEKLSEYLFLTNLNNIIYKLKYPRLNAKDIEIQ